MSYQGAVSNYNRLTTTPPIDENFPSVSFSLNQKSLSQIDKETVLLIYSRLFCNSLTFEFLSVWSRVEIRARSCSFVLVFGSLLFIGCGFLHPPVFPWLGRTGGHCRFLSLLNLERGVVPLSHLDKAEGVRARVAAEGEAIPRGDSPCSWWFGAHPP